MAGLLPPRDSSVLVGTETGDDAGVYLVGQDLALVVTADYITPPFDDPEAFGRIAAANALSDVYAMGGRPRAALNLCVFPKELAVPVAREILAGAAEKVREAGAAIVGGHTVRGPELLYGLSVTGTVSPGHLWRNVGARAGDALLLTKPLGTGLLISGYRRGLVRAAELAPVISGMSMLNLASAEALGALPVHACTDVTGFGLLGHALGMARGGVTLHIAFSMLPLYPGALELAARGVTCAGAGANRRACAGEWEAAAPLGPAEVELLHDPQTSGGLLVALPEADSAQALMALRAAGVDAARIGHVAAGPPRIVVDP